MLFDVYYVEDWSLSGDLIWRTPEVNLVHAARRSLLSMVVSIELGTRPEPEILVAASSLASPPQPPIGTGTKSRDRLVAEPVP